MQVGSPQLIAKNSVDFETLDPEYIWVVIDVTEGEVFQLFGKFERPRDNLVDMQDWFTELRDYPLTTEHARRLSKVGHDCREGDTAEYLLNRYYFAGKQKLTPNVFYAKWE